MASGDNEVGVDLNRPQDLHFVDHVEVKITSPEKEVISPTKNPFKKTGGLFINGQGSSISEGNKKTNDLDEEAEIEKSQNSDSGLDSSNNNSETQEELFIDRQESYKAVEEQEVLTSPNRTVDHLFNFLDSASSQSLDALNNNSEVIIGDNSEDDDSEENDVIDRDIYLGKEVELHIRENGSPAGVKGKESDEASMNLYWYTTTLDVNIDMKELEEFQENSQSGNVRSDLHLNIANRYYNSKTLDIDLDAANQNVYKSEATLNIKPNKVEKEKWSPAFESASSRLLDLASELKSEPKVQKNKENEMIRSDMKFEKHPWGLDENRVQTGTFEKGHDDLPEIVEVSGSQTEQRVIEMLTEIAKEGKQLESLDHTDSVGVGKYITRSSERMKEAEDAADAIGYMELADRPIEHSYNTEDLAGYMEVEDSQVEQVIGKTESNVLRAENKKTTLLKSKRKGQSSEAKTVTVESKACPEDVADAIGYMELSDRPVEEILAHSEKVLKTIQQEIEQKNLLGAESSIKVESQLTGVQLRHETEESEENKNNNRQGFDMPDAKIELNEKSVKLETENLDLENVNEKSELKASVQVIPFDPFTIRRKYLVGNVSEDTLQKLGGMFLESETFVDEYLDDEDYTLTLNDCWLRLRNKKFEMKLNAGFGLGPNKSPSVQMLTNENEIKEILIEKHSEELQQRRKVSESHLDVLIDALNIKEFVTFETTRNRYQIEDFIVTMDTTNFTYHVGEIEVVANTASEMMRLLDHMDVLSQKLGFLPLQSLSC